jgi:hypothetical protein
LFINCIENIYGNVTTDTFGRLCSIEDETGNVRQFTSPAIGKSMSKIVMDTSGNVYSPDTDSNCVYKLSSDFKFSKIITSLSYVQYI